MYPGRRRPGDSYPGFINALAACSERLLEGMCRVLREGVQEVAAEHWTVRGWVLFGSDGSKYELPMTEANEHVHGCASKRNSVPQLYVTMLFHVGSGLPWAFVRGPACSSEREQLRQMLDLLPAQAMLTADAGCTGYDLLQQIMAGGRSFVIRVGANVTLLHELGYVRERGQTVYLWPQDKQGVDRKGRRPKDLSQVCPPLVLRTLDRVRCRGYAAAGCRRCSAAQRRPRRLGRGGERW